MEHAMLLYDRRQIIIGGEKLKYREEECINMNPIENLKNLIVYQSQNNDNISIEVLYDNEDFWLTQNQCQNYLM